MKDRRNKSLWPLHDYSRARQSALAWLGERYVLAAPVRTPVVPPPTRARRLHSNLSIATGSR